MALTPTLQKSEPYPESAQVREQEAELRQSMMKAGMAAGSLAAAGLLLWRLARKN
jgi:hypothetical protein